MHNVPCPKRGVTTQGVIVPQKADALPKWVSEYFPWHAAIGAQLPGEKLLTDPHSPKLLIRMCLGLCGGLNDRLAGQPDYGPLLGQLDKKSTFDQLVTPAQLERPSSQHF